MNVLRCRSISRALNARKLQKYLPIASFASYFIFRRQFHGTSPSWAIKPQVLKDVGEGITEIQIIQWYAQEGAHIEEWKPLCQYQSDKAVDDVSSIDAASLCWAQHC